MVAMNLSTSDKHHDYIAWENTFNTYELLLLYLLVGNTYSEKDIFLEVFSLKEKPETLNLE